MCYVVMAGEILLVPSSRFGWLTDHYTRIKDFFSSTDVPLVTKVYVCKKPTNNHAIIHACIIRGHATFYIANYLTIIYSSYLAIAI